MCQVPNIKIIHYVRTEKEFTCSSQKDRPGQACVFAPRILLKIWSWKFIIQPHRHWRPIWAVTSGLMAANVVPCRHSHPSVFHASWKSILPVPPHDSVSTAFPCFRTSALLPCLWLSFVDYIKPTWQNFAPYFGGGVSQNRYRLRVPPTQELLQGLHALQGPQPAASFSALIINMRRMENLHIHIRSVSRDRALLFSRHEKLA